MGSNPTSSFHQNNLKVDVFRGIMVTTKINDTFSFVDDGDSCVVKNGELGLPENFQNRLSFAKLSQSGVLGSEVLPLFVTHLEKLRAK